MRVASFLSVVAAAAFATPAAAAPASAQAGTAGCGKTQPLSNVYRGLTSSGRVRTYSVHLPDNYSETTPYPVVIGFHGSSSIGLFFEADTKLSEDRFSANV